MKIFVTGGAGFIGSELIRQLIHETSHQVVNIDKLTYAGNLASLREVESSDRYRFERADITDPVVIGKLFDTHQPDAVLHLAAESHVDRSIDGPSEFIQTNIVGTYNLLECSRGYWKSLDGNKASSFRFQHISTDEVYGSLGSEGYFLESTAYDPSSPYSASKASSDHLVRAWHRTFGLPVLITNCSNNYGPFQFPEKLIPLMILNCLSGKPLPVYGKGENIRDWLYVGDHAKALRAVLENGKVGETYNIGGHNEKMNIEVVKTICDIVDEQLPDPDGKSRRELISYVTDRPGHDMRYAIDAGKIERELGWKPEESFESGIRKTVEWYLDNREWWEDVASGRYLERQGLEGNQS